MASQVNGWTVTFVLDQLGRTIRVPVSTGFDELHKLVAAKFKVSVEIELVYVDSSTGDAMVLDVDDDLPSLLSQNFKWKVLAGAVPNSAANAVAAATPAANNPSAAPSPPTVSEGKYDEAVDEAVDCKKENQNAQSSAAPAENYSLR
ncbi:hypothetical protein DFJ73DRAFT_762055 [Zopfochytrium polystomum]|nr:hypothetical protein DFJ73DRAFT_762055 [Zopfochytrium polystomum]